MWLLIQANFNLARIPTISCCKPIDGLDAKTAIEKFDELVALECTEAELQNALFATNENAGSFAPVKYAQLRHADDTYVLVALFYTDSKG